MSSEIVRGRVPEELKSAFLSIAASRGLNESSAIHFLVRNFVDQEKQLRRRNEETLEALADVESGLVVDGDKVLEWVASWGTPNEKEAPK